MSKRNPGHFYEDIALEFEMARINFGIFMNDREKLNQKDFDPTVSPSMINNVVAGRSSHNQLRSRIVRFTEKWYWDFEKKTEKINELTSDQ